VGASKNVYPQQKAMKKRKITMANNIWGCASFM